MVKVLKILNFINWRWKVFGLFDFFFKKNYVVTVLRNKWKRFSVISNQNKLLCSDLKSVWRRRNKSRWWSTKTLWVQLGSVWSNNYLTLRVFRYFKLQVKHKYNDRLWLVKLKGVSLLYKIHFPSVCLS